MLEVIQSTVVLAKALDSRTVETFAASPRGLGIADDCIVNNVEFSS